MPVDYAGRHESSFSTICVRPYERMLLRPTGQSGMIGGPDFPDFENRSWERHNAFGNPVDTLKEPDKCSLRLAGTWFWCGPITDDFSHQMAEFMHRVPLGLSPGGLLFSSSPAKNGAQLRELPVFVKESLEYLGASWREIHVASEPVLVEKLLVLSQGSQVGVAPANEYLQALSRIQAVAGWGERHGSGRKIYLSRAGLAFRHICAESYIEQILSEAGVEILRPEAMRFRDLLKSVASASMTIASEGGAVHGLELLGYFPGPMTIIARRAPKSSGYTALVTSSRARARNGFGVLNAIDSWLTVGANQDGSTHPNGLALLDAPRLLAGLSEIGLAAASAHFNKDHFVIVAEHDFRAYMDSFYARLVSDQPGYRERVVSCEAVFSDWRTRQLTYS